jgi:hypothetical protein
MFRELPSGVLLSAGNKFSYILPSELEKVEENENVLFHLGS